MRRGLAVFLLINTVMVIFLVHSVFGLIRLLFEDPTPDAISRTELVALNSSEAVHDRPPLQIPKILHQTYKNETIPAHWRPAQQSCIDLHPDYEYILWTDARARELIRTEYAWFLETFDGYAYAIQRADAIRYFVLSHYGGVYLDLDDGCNRPMDPLLTFDAWVRHTTPKGISNDAMGAVPHHPFFRRVIESLQSYDRSWLLPYVTIMYSTGPLFLSVIWQSWTGEHGDQGGADWPGRVRILMKAEYNGEPWAFFQHYRGSSWHRGDARFIFWMGRHWLMLTVFGFAIAGLLIMGAWYLSRRFLLGAVSPATRPPILASDADLSTGSHAPPSRSWSARLAALLYRPGKPGSRIVPFWPTLTGYKQLPPRRRGGRDVNDQYYELDDQWDP